MKTTEMETGKHLGIIKAKAHSIRCPGKNLRQICGRPMLHWTLDVAVKSGVLAKIVVSTVEDGADEVRDVVHNYSNLIEVFVRDHRDQLQLEMHGFDYTASHYPEFTFCTGLFGTSWFVLPSWIRAADKVLRSIRRTQGIWDYPITNVDAFPQSNVDLVSSWRLEQRKWNHPFFLELRGCLLDIDTEEEFAQAEKVMQALLDTGYFNVENIHLKEAFWNTALTWNRF